MFMRWAGVGMAFGVVLLVLGGLVIAGGIAVSVVGPAAVDDWQREEDEPGGSENGNGGLLGLDGEGGEEEERRETRQEVRGIGVLIMAAGAVCAFLGGVLYAVGRGAEANRRAREDVEPPKKQMPLT